MSDELIFDSERQMLRAEKKRRLVPLLTLAAVLVMVAAAVLILRGCRAEQYSGGESTAYPYIWSLKSNGDAQLIVPHGDVPEGRWDLKDREESLPVLRVAREGKESKAGTAFSLHPEAAGRCLFTLVLRSAEDALIPNYEMTILAEVRETDGKLSASLLNASGTHFQGEIDGGDGKDHHYRISSDASGRLVLSSPVDETETDWEYEITEGAECVEVLGLLYEEGSMNFYLRAGTLPGLSGLVLRSENAAAKITLTLESGADGSLKVVSHEAEYGEKAPVEPDSSASDTTEAASEDVVATTGGIPIFSDDHHLEMSEDPAQESLRP